MWFSPQEYQHEVPQKGGSGKSEDAGWIGGNYEVEEPRSVNFTVCLSSVCGPGAGERRRLTNPGNGGTSPH
jgi:hypothetical protein